MSGPWAEVTLGDIVEFFDSKRVPLSSVERESRHGAYPYYGASGIIDTVDDYLFEGRYLLVAEDGENLNSRKVPVAFFAGGQFWVNNHAHVIRGKPNIANDEFLHAWFANSDLSPYITGAAQPKLSQSSMKRIRLKLPSLAIQERIGAILFAYQSLVENNMRRIQILEEMAQAIYREWFVEFRFPGHEGVQRVESEVGPVPEGWAVTNLGRLVLDVRDSCKPGRWTEVNPYVPIDCIASQSLCLRETRPGSEARSSLVRFQPGDVLFGAMRPYFHKVAVAPFEGTTRTTCFILRPYDPDYWSYAVMRLFEKSTIDFASSHSSGTTIPYARWESLSRMPAVVPPSDLALRFEEVVSPMLESISKGFAFQENLKATRDLLLPRLISGELDVSDLDIDTSGLVA